MLQIHGIIEITTSFVGAACHRELLSFIITFFIAKPM